MKKILLTTCMLAMMNVVFAGSSVNIPLNGGNVQPKGQLDVSIAPLGQGTYDIHCTINVTDSTIFSFNGPGQAYDYHPTLEVNGKKIGNFTFSDLNAPLNKGNNDVIVLAEENYDNSYIVIKNLDDSVTGVVSNCYAVPSLGNSKK